MLSTIEKALFLKTITLFEAMTPEQLKILSNISEEMTFHSGDVLFNEGDPADDLYVIVDGEIEVVKNYGSPQQIRLATLGTKSSFGEMALFGSDGRSATAVASADSTFLTMRKELLLLLIQENPAISTAIVFQLANIIRENNTYKPLAREDDSGEEAEKKNGATARRVDEPPGSEKRQFPRFSIPGVVDVPVLSDQPVTVDNISAGGMLLSLDDEPDPNATFEMSLKINDRAYVWNNVAVAWTNKKDDRHSPWETGLKVDLSSEEREEFENLLGDMAP